MQYDRRMMQADQTFERLGAGNEKRKRRRREMKGHSCTTSCGVCISVVQTENGGKPARRLGEVPQPLTLSERNPSQQEADRGGEGSVGQEETEAWNETWPAPFRVREDVVNAWETYSEVYEV